MKNKNIVGSQIRRLRSEQGLSQPALAAKCQRLGWDINRDTIAKIEAHRRWVGDFELVYLSRCFDVPIQRLFETGSVKILFGNAALRKI